MPNHVTVLAVRTFRYKGRLYAKGDAVVMTPIDASIAVRLGHVSLSTKAPAPEPTKRRYRRRDLEVEP